MGVAMFAVGDVVILKSGGPVMTVSGLPTERSSGVFCRWFDEAGELRGQRLPEATLKPVTENGA